MNNENNELAQKYKNLIGKTLVELDKESGLEKATNNHVLESELPKPRRVIKPGRRYSTEYIENRLNFSVNSSGKIVNVNIG